MNNTKNISEIIYENISKPDFIKGVLSNKRKKSMPYKRVNFRPIILDNTAKFQIELVEDKKIFHENLSLDEAVKRLLNLVKDCFKQINFYNCSEEVQILCKDIKKPYVSTKNIERNRVLSTKQTVSSMNTPAHNKSKNYIIQEGIPCDFLIKLGVMDEKGVVFHKHYSKFRQINRFLEIVEDVYDQLPKGETIKIIDFGCGKAYLTFALYYYLRKLKDRNVEIIGLDLKKDVIEFCSMVAKELSYEGLKFIMGDIADFKASSAHMVVTLHACDTATDYALINAVKWNSKIILSVPCCQHELFKQIKNDIHQPMLKHGILKDRLCEYLTDGLRALKLEEMGYNVNLIEFTTLEHTAKNIMIRAVKSPTANSYKRKLAKEQYNKLKEFYGVNPTIDRL